MESIALPPFGVSLWLGALVIFAVCGFLLLLWRGPAGSSSQAAALTPFLIPAGVTAFVVLVVSSIGMTLLTVGKQLAVPLALLLALLVLGIGAYLSMRPETPD